VNDKSGSDHVKPAFFRRLFGRKEGAGAPAETSVQHETPEETLPDEIPAVDPPATETVEEPAFVPPPPEAIQDAVLDAMAADAGTEFSLATEDVPEPPVKRSWWSRLREGLARSSSALGTGIAEIFTKRKLDRAMLEELEDVLIRSDLGVTMAARIAEAVGKGRYDRQVSPEDVKTILADEVERVLGPLALPIAIDAAQKPFVILVVGVNGSGKTTTIGKLAAKFTSEGKSVTLAAGDTFRAAAIAQLKIWGERLGCDVVAREQGGDAASLAYEAIEAARASGADILLMDTAGRLQNRAELMAELEKIIRVMKKVDASAPHAVLLVLDATVGQNAMNQVEIFGKVAGVTGLVMTKLDGTARGGILVAIAEKFKLPVHFIGVGETAEDLEPFLARDFAEAIAGIERAG
jgi:fused signal recognition particle receptor